MRLYAFFEKEDKRKLYGRLYYFIFMLKNCTIQFHNHSYYFTRLIDVSQWKLQTLYFVFSRAERILV